MVRKKSRGNSLVNFMFKVDFDVKPRQLQTMGDFLQFLGKNHVGWGNGGHD